MGAGPVPGISADPGAEDESTGEEATAMAEVGEQAQAGGAMRFGL